MKTDWQKGDRIKNRWEVHDVLAGGMGRVYLVYDRESAEPFAVKTIKEELFKRDSQIIERFRRESLAWVNLERHQNVTQARFLEIIDHSPFLFLELVSGGDLSTLIGTPQLVENFPRILNLAIQFCDGMMHVLSRGIEVHRDVKASNCLITQEGTLKVTDFGLAKIFDDASVEQTREAETLDLRYLLNPFYKRKKNVDSTYESASPLTGISGRVGTSPYMAPEQFTNPRHVDTRADIYSFGVLLFEMATGQRPFTATNWANYKRQHQTQNPPLETVNNESLRAIIEKCLFKEPRQRYQSFAEIRTHLARVHECLTGTPAPVAITSLELSSSDWVNKGFSLGNLGKTAEAILCYDRAIELNPENPVAWNNKGYALLQLGKFESVLNCFERATQLEPKFEEAWINRGRDLSRQARIDEAISCYDTLIQLNQSNADAWNNKGACLASLGRLEEAVGCFDRAIGFDPVRIEFQTNRFGTLLRLERWREALSWYEARVLIEPRFVDWLESQARPFVPNKELLDFECFLGEMRRKNAGPQIEEDQTAIIWNNRGLDAAVRRQFAEAIKYYDRALAISPNMIWALNNKGVALRETGSLEAALVCHERVIELDPQFAEGWNDKGNVLSELRKYTEALMCYDRALEIDAMHPKAWYNKGNLLFDLGRHPEAIACYERSLEISPLNASAWYNKGLLLMQQLDFKKAANCFEETLKIEPEHHKARMNLDMASRYAN